MFGSLADGLVDRGVGWGIHCPSDIRCADNHGNRCRMVFCGQLDNEGVRMGTMTMVASQPAPAVVPAGSAPKLAGPDHATLAPIAEDIEVSVEQLRQYMAANDMDVDELVAEVSAAKMMGDKWLKRLVSDISGWHHRFVVGTTMSPSCVSTGTRSRIVDLGYGYSPPIIGT